MDQWISLLCGAYAAAGCALPSSRIPKNFVALQRARRCGPRIAFVASECLRISLFPQVGPPLPVKIRECNWDYNQVGSIGSVTLLKRVIATFQKWKAKSKYNLVDVMLQCHVSNDAHRLNCHEMSGKRFHGLVTVYWSLCDNFLWIHVHFLRNFMD